MNLKLITLVYFFTKVSFATVNFNEFLKNFASGNSSQNFVYPAIYLRLHDKKVLPKKLRLVPGLRTLYIDGENINQISNGTLLNEIPNIKKLVLHESCKLCATPAWLNDLTNIKRFVFRDNPIKYCSEGFLQLLKKDKDIRVDLRNTELQYDSANGVGFSLLKPYLKQVLVPKRFGLFGSGPIPLRMAKEICGFLKSYCKQNILHINPVQLREYRGTPIDQNNKLEAQEFFWAFEKLLESFELHDKNAPNYLDFELFRDSIEELEPWVKEISICDKVTAEVLKPGQRKASYTNAELIQEILFPKLRGFCKQLFGIPLATHLGEKPGAQPHDWDRDIVQNALSTAITMMNDEKDGAERVAMFQVTDGLLHCLEGYIEALNTVIFRDRNHSVDETDLETTLRRLFVSLKRPAFLSAAIDGSFFQSAHQASYYLYYLGSTVGLETCAPGYQEISNAQLFYDAQRGKKRVEFRSDWVDYYGSNRNDPLLGESNPENGIRIEYLDSKGNFLDAVLKEFLMKRFTPLYLARQILDSYQSYQDFEEEMHFASLDKTIFRVKKNLENDLARLQHDYEEAIKAFHLGKVSLQYELDQQFNDRIQRGENAPDLEKAFEDELKRYDLRLTEIIEIFEFDINEVKKNLEVVCSPEENEKLTFTVTLGQRTNNNKTIRSVSFANVFLFVKEKGLIKEDTSSFGFSGLHQFFDLKDPIVNEYGEIIYAPLTEMGALNILAATGYVVKNYGAIDEGSISVLLQQCDFLKGIYRGPSPVSSHEYVKDPLWLRQLKISEKLQVAIEKLNRQKDGQIKNLANSHEVFSVKKEQALANLREDQEVRGVSLENELSLDDEDYKLKVQNFEDECEREILLLEEEWKTKEHQDLNANSSHDEAISRIKSDYIAELEAIKWQSKSEICVTFSDVISAMMNHELVHYNEDNNTYTGMEKYFDMSTIVYDDQQKIVHADFLMFEANEIGIAAFIQDSGFIMGAYGTDSHELNGLIEQIANAGR